MWTRRNEGEKPRDYVGGGKKRKRGGEVGVVCRLQRKRGVRGGEKNMWDDEGEEVHVDLNGSVGRSEDERTE